MTSVFRNLVFEGGGVKGIAYGGALRRLDELGVLRGISRVAGSSAGAITAALLAVGYSAAELSGLIAGTDFSQFADRGSEPAADPAKWATGAGWHKGAAFEKWVGERIRGKTGDAGLAFGGLQDLKRDGQSVRDLYVAGTNLSRLRTEYYSHETTPDMAIRQAVRISMSIPFYFQCVVSPDGDILVDAGVTNNYPIAIFDKARYLDSPAHGKTATHGRSGGL